MKSKPTVQIVRFNTLTFHTEHFGDRNNPTCLLIAGAMAPARFWTDIFCDLLVNSGFFVIRYDHRDIGESCAVDWQTHPYTLSDLAHDAISILGAYGIQQAHFVGHSMGGYIAQTIALEFPKNTLSICSISAGPIGATKDTDHPLSDEEQTILAKTWDIMLSRQDGPSKETKIQSFLPIWKYLNGKFPFDEEMAYAYTKDLILRSQHPIRAGNNHELVMRSLDIEKSKNILQKVDLPTLIIQGTADPLVLPRNGAALSSAIPKSHLTMISGMGHMFFDRGLEKEMADLICSHMKNTSRNILERNMLLHMTYFAGKMPQIKMLPYEDVAIIRSDISDDMFNYVLSARFTKENVARRVDQVIHMFQEHDLPFSWWVGESDSPTDLKNELCQQGLMFKEKDVGMILDLQSFFPKTKSQLHFKRVSSAGALQDFGDIILAIGGHPECYERIYRHIPLSILQENSLLQMHIAYLEGRPIVSGILVLGDNMGGIYYVATVPEERGKGYGTAMMEHLLNLAKQRGYFLAGLEASHEGLNLYKRLGFKEVCIFEEYAWTKQ